MQYMRGRGLQRMTRFVVVALAVCMVVVMVHAHVDSQRPDCGVCNSHAMPGLHQESNNGVTRPESQFAFRSSYVPNLKRSHDIQIRSGRAPPTA